VKPAAVRERQDGTRGKKKGTFYFSIGKKKGTFYFSIDAVSIGA
jgi:hypothetical protein